MKEQVEGYIREIEKQPADILSQEIPADANEGLEEMASMLTFLPEERRKGAVVGFVMAMWFCF